MINPANPFIARPQTGCAAFEVPLVPGDEATLGEGLDETVRRLVLDDSLKPRRGPDGEVRMYWARPEPPAPAVGLRTGSAAEFRLLDAGTFRLIGTVDDSRVFHVAHPGALYLHQGRQYRVTDLDLDRQVALVAAEDADEYTQPRHDIDITITGEDKYTDVGRSTLHLGEVAVSTATVAYQRRKISTGGTIQVVPLDLPLRTLPTRACWYTIPERVVAKAKVESGQVLGAVHAAEHAMIGMLPLFAICDRWDVGGVSMAVHPATGEPTIFIYDGYPGGAGIAELAFEAADRHLSAALDVIAGCGCEQGCPSCVQSPKCGNWNEYLDKGAAAALLRAVLR